MPQIKSSAAESTAPWWHSALSGCAAGAGARLVVAPLDLLRIRLQVQPNKTIMTHIQRVSSECGITGFFRGNVPATYLWMGYSAIQFAAYARVSEVVNPYASKGSTAFISGALAGVTATLITYPLDVCRTSFAGRLLSDGAPETMLTFARNMYSRQGLQGFFAGIAPGLYGIVPYMGFNFLIYETLVGEKTAINAGMAGAVAGASSKLLVYPLDTVKKRLQVQAYYNMAEAESNNYKGMMDCLTRIVREEGATSLYRGLVPSMLKNTIATSLSFALYTKAQNILAATYA